MKKISLMEIGDHIVVSEDPADMLLLLKLADVDVEVELPETENRNACLAVPVALVDRGMQKAWKCDVWFDREDKDEPYEDYFSVNSEEGKEITEIIKETYREHFDAGAVTYVLLPVSPNFTEVFASFSVGGLVKLLHRTVARKLTMRVDPAREYCQKKFGGVGA